MTDMLVWKKGIVKVDSVKSLIEALKTYQGDIWGLQVFAHGSSDGECISMPPSAEMNKNPLSFEGIRWTTQDNLIDLVRQGGYRISCVYMMQCYSGVGEYEKRWRQAAIDFYGYKGMNVLGADMGAGYWPWNWNW